MVIVVTGAVGIGKTTVCRKLIGILQNQGHTCGGILTCKANDGSIIIEDIQSGDKETLASVSDVYQGPRTARYYFNPEGIRFGLEAIDRGTSAAVLLVDEIGHLELRGEGFTSIFELIRVGKANHCVLVIRSELLPAFLRRLLTAPSLFETTIDTRDRLPQEIGSILLEKLAEERRLSALSG